MDKNPNLIPFNKWSRERIAEGRKFCTSRSRRYKNDPRVKYILPEPLTVEFIINYLWQPEGADSPEELAGVFRGIFRFAGLNLKRKLWVHFGDFRE